MKWARGRLATVQVLASVFDECVGPRSKHETELPSLVHIVHIVHILDEKSHSQGFILYRDYCLVPQLRAQLFTYHHLQPSPLFAVTLDASCHGIGISVSISPRQIYRLEGMHFEGVTNIVMLEDTPEAQVHREAARAPMVMRLARRLYDLRCRTVLMRNDCSPVVFAMRKGSQSLRL